MDSSQLDSKAGAQGHAAQPLKFRSGDTEITFEIVAQKDVESVHSEENADQTVFTDMVSSDDDEADEEEDEDEEEEEEEKPKKGASATQASLSSSDEDDDDDEESSSSNDGEAVEKTDAPLTYEMLPSVRGTVSTGESFKRARLYRQCGEVRRIDVFTDDGKEITYEL